MSDDKPSKEHHEEWINAGFKPGMINDTPVYTAGPITVDSTTQASPTSAQDSMSTHPTGFRRTILRFFAGVILPWIVAFIATLLLLHFVPSRIVVYFCGPILLITLVISGTNAAEYIRQ